MNCFSSLPEGCVSDILCLTSPRDVCRSSAISWVFKSAADSDTVWEKFLPSDHREILSRSTSPLPPFSTKKQLYFYLADSPILLEGAKLTFSLDKEAGKKCYMLGARELKIVWGSSPEYWNWTSLPQSRFPEVAKLLNVCWLEISGNIMTRLLSPKTTYVAYLVFKIAPSNYGFDSLLAKASVRFVGESEDGAEDETSTVYLKFWRSRVTSSVKNRQLPQKRKDWWMEIVLGEFFNDEENDREVEMRLMEIGAHWKSGLIVEGIELRPKVDA